ncbi:metal ABC transporter ATP-binding protein [Cryobacterium melibiosiphilum]|uniref:Metal ABC transporter ATP-binding protein n=1 Tax=Cryobacterium melibiosiphilum TaxID=995039 RepID=A0A3A5MIW4_9MICO|nr:metal ABC transporter ATP-binding protein [Cryobacterium melibiosiphilum]RJT86968.1 metal ABC transporter ATP-binding protein [Cryobacterium melibiosiphilum]
MSTAVTPATETETDTGPRPGTTGPAIEVRDVTVRYGDVTALDRITLTVASGQIVGLLGMNGSGKSTLFNALMGLAKPDAGSIRLFDGNAKRARLANQVAYVPQSESVDWDFPISVREVVMMGRYGTLGFTRRAKAADRQAVAEAIERVGLTSLAHRQIGALSGGQRKRAFVARGIAQNARLLLLDEPFAGVDTTSQATISRLLHELRDEGRTILISTHDLAGVPALCDDVVLLQRRILFQGPPDQALTPALLARAFESAEVPSDVGSAA